MIKKVNQISSMPQMRNAFRNWQSSVTLKKLTQTVVDGFVQSSEIDITFKGVVQPLRGEELNLKPEGQRSFRWLQIHCFSGDDNLKNDDRIVFNGERYKVMVQLDYSLNGYIEYHAIEDYS